MIEQLPLLMADGQDRLDFILSRPPRASNGFQPWVKVEDLCFLTGLTRREIRELASERGYAAGNYGIAKMEMLEPDEQLAALRRIEGQAKAMLVRRKKMRNHMRIAGTYPLKGI
jgi:hypothetical protein